MNRPQVVSREEWQAARDELMVKEKALTRAQDALAAERRRLPMVRVRSDHEFTAPDGSTVAFPGLFDGKRQLVVYHFMRAAGSAAICGGCATFTDNVPDLPHLAARDTRLILMAPAPQEEIEPVRARFGWTTPWYSAYGNGLYEEIGLGGGFALSVFLRDGDEVFHTYETTSRGVDRLRLDFSLLDLTPYGRQEQWEDSPEGWPQDPTMRWLRLRDEY
ncbi:DUF899 domain-containing protein [Actinokineospora cianjurensis]|uniref:Putative dithiol-disulfide oxidoreductase (DUF899 family) n=1 Tax=Actinokineospora cianjurensis TaxID=585224 RepID=A0A421B1B4_9PSEU|nr:DUF899 family protein [Actinokineospora cianjurensis]RLK58118.1 putative dithiol-disulfide oxidoreductase (DUF899 family) [Actinokineospora cianjurensis]